MPSDESGKDSTKAQQHLANERTFLSWLRTSIALIGLGFIIARFGIFLREFNLIIGADGNDVSSEAEAVLIAEHSFSSFLGLSMVALGVGLVVIALQNFLAGSQQIEKGVYVQRKKIIYTAGLVLAAFGLVMIAYLVAVSF